MNEEIMHYVRRKIGGKVFWVDKADEPLLLSHTWFPSTRDYLIRHEYLGVLAKELHGEFARLNFPEG